MDSCLKTEFEARVGGTLPEQTQHGAPNPKSFNLVISETFSVAEVSLQQAR